MLCEEGGKLGNQPNLARGRTIVREWVFYNRRHTDLLPLPFIRLNSCLGSESDARLQSKTHERTSIIWGVYQHLFSHHHSFDGYGLTNTSGFGAEPQLRALASSIVHLIRILTTKTLGITSFCLTAVPLTMLGTFLAVLNHHLEALVV